jgi:hypothetical protein
MLWMRRASVRLLRALSPTFPDRPLHYPLRTDRMQSFGCEDSSFGPLF